MRSCTTLAGVVVTVSASMGAVCWCHEACESPIAMCVLKKESSGLMLNEKTMKAEMWMGALSFRVRAIDVTHQWHLCVRNGNANVNHIKYRRQCDMLKIFFKKWGEHTINILTT